MFSSSSFNGATTLQSWKPKKQVKKLLDRLCFNGATTLQSWKHRFDNIGGYEFLSFNGATTLQSWKHGQRTFYFDPNQKVSMGPRHYSRGNDSHFQYESFHSVAVSMGPRHYSRGNGITVEL